MSRTTRKFAIYRVFDDLRISTVWSGFPPSVFLCVCKYITLYEKDGRNQNRSIWLTSDFDVYMKDHVGFYLFRLRH